MEGRKDVPGMYVGENESARFWLSIMNGLKTVVQRDPDCLCGWAVLIPAGDSSCLSSNRNTAMYHSPNLQFHEVCFLQRHQKPDGGFKACIRRTNRRACLK